MKYIILNAENMQVNDNSYVTPNDYAIACPHNNNACWNFLPGGGGPPPKDLINGGEYPKLPRGY